MSNVLQVELTKGKIKQLVKHLNTKRSTFTDKRFLESLGQPVKTIGRQEEAEKILETIYPSKDGYMVSFVSVYGSSGTGKSTITRLVCDGITDRVSYSFVNLRKAKTIFGCANLILNELDCKSVKSSEGINTAIDSIEKQIVEILERDKKHHFVLVLDEFDEIFSDVRSHPSDFVYKLLHLVERLRTKGFWFCVIAISNTDLSDYTLDDRVKSRMDRHEIFFKPYTKKDLLPILEERAQKAFAGPVRKEVLERCAQLSGAESGDCRRALQLLRITGELAKGQKLDVKHVSEATKTLDKDNLDETLKTATFHQKSLLAALAKLVLFTEREEHSTREIFDEYRNLVVSITVKDKDIHPLEYRRAFDLMCLLETNGIIFSKHRSNGRYGNKKFYQLTLHHDLVGYTIDKDWWFSLQDRKASDERILAQANKAIKKRKKMGYLR